MFDGRRKFEICVAPSRKRSGMEIRMHRRFISTIAMMMVMTLTLTGCTSEASNVGVAKDKQQAVDTGFTVATAGSYDSADTAVVISRDQENSAVVFMNMETGKQYTLYYDGTTYVKDKHDGPMTISQVEPGDVVDVTFLKGKKRLASIKQSPQAWVYDEIENYDFGGPNKTASIGSTTYSLPDDVVVLSEGRRSEVMDVVAQDVVSVSGIDHKIYSISVERGHGYLRLKNDQALIGGWIEVGNSVIREITEDMLLVVPEGSYQVLLSHNGVSATKDVIIERNKEVVLDVSDLEIPESRTGRILFSVTPDTAKVSIDGKVVDISKAVELPYGIHQIHLEAKGYDSLTRYIQVGSEYATISFEMEEEREEERRTVSNNTIDDYQPAEPVQKEDTLSSLSQNALSAKGGDRVYIDSPKNVEVYLDGNYIGISPVSFGKTVGSHTITLRKSGYKTRSYTIYLYNDGKDTTYSFSELEQETVSGNSTNGSLSENSLIKVNVETQEDVDIYLGGEHVGTAHATFERKPGSYLITLKREGYKSVSYKLELEISKPSVIYRLEPLWEKLEEDDCDHDYKEEITTEPTCTQDGEKTLTCTKCEKVKKEPIPAKGHHYGDDGICKDCGTEKEEPEQPEHKHSYTDTVTKKPTCTEKGEKTFTCECGYSYTEPISATGHNYVNGKCTYCGAEETKPDPDPGEGGDEDGKQDPDNPGEGSGDGGDGEKNPDNTEEGSGNGGNSGTSEGSTNPQEPETPNTSQDSTTTKPSEGVTSTTSQRIELNSASRPRRRR